MKIFKESILDIIRHRTTSVLFSGVVAITVFILCIFASVIYNMDSIEKKWSRELKIIAFPADASDPNLVLGEIKKIPSIIDAVVIEPSKVAELIKKRFPNQELNMSEAVLPSMIEIRTKVNAFEDVKREISKIPEIEEITANTSWFDSLRDLISAIMYVSLILSGLVFFMGALLISYVTKLGVLQRRPEINVMRFCGATEWYIRKPYLLTGLVLGFLGGVAGVFIYFGLNYFLQNIIGHFIDTWKTINPIQILIISTVAMLLGAIGNFMAFSRGEEDD